MTTAASTAPAAPIRVAAGTTAGAAVRDAGLPSRGEPDAIVVVRDGDGRLRDLSWTPDSDAEVVPVLIDEPDGLDILRHSAAHVLAQAVQQEFADAKLGIGPPITDGFYYDFDVPEAFTPDDLEKLEKRMQKIVKDGQLFSRRVYESKDQAREELANEPYKLELIGLAQGPGSGAEVAATEGASQEVAAGESVGYGSVFRAERPTRIGVVACGYADGYPRHAPHGARPRRRRPGHRHPPGRAPRRHRHRWLPPLRSPRWISVMPLAPT